VRLVSIWHALGTFRAPHARRTAIGWNRRVARGGPSIGGRPGSI
jgi:hypothetical protein